MSGVRRDDGECLRFQLGTLKDGRRGSRYQPYAFTDDWSVKGIENGKKNVRGKSSRCQNATLNQTNVSAAENLDVANCDIQIRIRILSLRGTQVMFDRDLAELYGVEVKRLNQQVNRNIERFPETFAFQLSRDELTNLKLQNATSSCESPDANLKSQIATSSWGGAMKLPSVFTEGRRLTTYTTRDPKEIAKVLANV